MCNNTFYFISKEKRNQKLLNSYVPGIYYVTFDREIVLRGCRDEETEAQGLGPFLEIDLAKLLIFSFTGLENEVSSIQSRSGELKRTKQNHKISNYKPEC